VRTENWCGYDIRFIEINGEWYAILKDICDALKLRAKDVSQRISPNMLERVRIEAGSSDLKYEPVKRVDSPTIGKDIGAKRGAGSFWMLAVNELGIYEALFASRKLEARKFRMWAGTVMQKLRKNVGLQGYEVMQMTDPEIQDRIDDILDTLFWDDEKQMLMQSVTVAGGDVDQVPFE
jgi:prophage antirepressor-like protein